MAKKKSKSTGKNKSKTKTKNKSNNLPVIAAVVIALMAGGYFVTQSGPPATDSTLGSDGGSTALATAGLIETRPTMAPNRFKGSVSTVYRWAGEIPEVFDKIYCYCRCKENPRFRHKTLLTCYTDTHASNCGICLKEGRMAWELTQKGLSPKEIRGEIDKYYGKLRSSRVF